jgi:hypothetical protein
MATARASGTTISGARLKKSKPAEFGPKKSAMAQIETLINRTPMELDRNM